MSDDKNYFGTKLSEILNRKAISQSALSRDLGVSRAYVSSLTTGSKAPSAEKTDKIADAVGATKTERRRLHTAAAADLGFKINIPKDF